MIAEHILFSYLMGVIMGIVDEWKRKLFFAIWILIVVIVIVGCYWGIQTGTPVIFTPSSPGWYYALTIPAVVLGMFTGSGIFKRVFRGQVPRQQKI